MVMAIVMVIRNGNGSTSCSCAAIALCNGVNSGRFWPLERDLAPETGPRGELTGAQTTLPSLKPPLLHSAIAAQLHKVLPLLLRIAIAHYGG